VRPARTDVQERLDDIRERPGNFSLAIVKAIKISRGEREVDNLRKLLIIGVMAALAALLIPSVVFAADPAFSAVMDVANGSVDITAKSFDTSTWHPGAVGETNTFSGLGGFQGNYTAYQGVFGSLQSYINVTSMAGGADFVMTDQQDFNVLSANHINNVIGNFMAHSSGNDDNVIMNMASVGSMYVWSESQVYSYPGLPYSGLQGGLIEKSALVTANGVPTANLYMGCTTTGLAKDLTPNSWGWAIGETGSATTNYSTSPSILATGSGTYTQTGFGQNYLQFNGFVMPGGGTSSQTSSFVGGLSGGFSMDAH
jgi:hypothetical protein